MAPVLAARAGWRFGPPAFGILLFLVAWQVGHWHYGSFILPSPLQTGAAIIQTLSGTSGWAARWDDRLPGSGWRWWCRR